MGIRWTGSRGQLERLGRRQSRQQGENQTEVQPQKQISEADRPKTGWLKLGIVLLWTVGFGLWLVVGPVLVCYGLMLIGDNLHWQGGLYVAAGLVLGVGGFYWDRKHLRRKVVMPVSSDFGVRMQVLLEKTRKIGSWIATLFVLGLVVEYVGAGVVLIYQKIDQAGWITHNHDTPVWIQGNWMVGEFRDCQMRTKTVAGGDKALDHLDKLPRLFCGKDANGLFDFQRTNGAAPPPPDQVPPEGAMYLYTVTGDELDQDFHVMPVRYNGRIDRTDKWVISWRCQRLNMGFFESAALECNALN